MLGITGGTGVLGRILISILEKNNIPFSVYQGDVRDTSNIYNWIVDASISEIVYFAAKVAVKEVNENKELAYDVNVNGIIQTLKAIKQSNQNIYFFYASSSHVYKSSNFAIKETDPIEPQNTYGLTKYIAETLLLDYANNENNFQICIGRIFSFYHDTQKPPYLYPTIMKRLSSEDLTKPFKLFGAYSERDFLNAEDVCQIILQIMQKKLGGIFNIGSGVSIRIIDFVQSLTDVDLIIDYDKSENKSILVADISKLKSYEI